jgi:hypothetical protein
MSVRRLRRLGEPVAGLAAGGGMQPTSVGASEPGGQATPELPADVGHRRAGERAGLLEAEVVELEPGDLAVAPAADDRLGDLVGLHAELGPGVGRSGAQLADEVGHEHQLIGLSFGVAGEQLINQGPVGLGNSRMQQRGRADDQDGADLEFAGGSWRQQEAEVTVGDPARLQHLTERARAQLGHCPPPAVLAMDARGIRLPGPQGRRPRSPVDQDKQERWRAQAAGRSRIRTVAAYRSMSASDSTWS